MPYKWGLERSRSRRLRLRGNLAIALVFFLLKLQMVWAQSHGADDSLLREQARQDSLQKSSPPQSIGFESILGPGWAGREPVKPLNTKPKPQPLITPRQYANSLALSLGANLVPVAVGATMLKEEVAVWWGLGLVMTGAIVGPSTGQFVYGYTTHGLFATTIRMTAFVGFNAVLFRSFGNCGWGTFGGTDESCSEGFDPTLGLIATGAAYFGGYLYGLIQPAFHIHHEPARTYLPAEVLPSLSYDAQGRSRTGVTAMWRF